MREAEKPKHLGDAASLELIVVCARADHSSPSSGLPPPNLALYRSTITRQRFERSDDQVALIVHDLNVKPTFD
jgi:hypothetical protein